MERRKEERIAIDTLTVEGLCCGLEELTGGVARSICRLTLNGILEQDKSKSERENAYLWMINNYDIINGTIELTQHISEILTNMLINYEVEIYRHGAGKDADAARKDDLTYTDKAGENCNTKNLY